MPEEILFPDRETLERSIEEQVQPVALVRAAPTPEEKAAQAAWILGHVTGEPQDYVEADPLPAPVQVLLVLSPTMARMISGL